MQNHKYRVKLSEGTYNIPIIGKGLLAGQIYIASITIGNSNTLIKTTALESGAFSGEQKSVFAMLGNTAIAKIQPSAPAIDTIVIKKIGFFNLTVPINSYESQLGMQNVKSSTMVAAAP